MDNREIIAHAFSCTIKTIVIINFVSQFFNSFNNDDYRRLLLCRIKLFARQITINEEPRYIPRIRVL